ncbi:MAG: imidazole glycerol phosphate synthase subunit HisH [Methylobacter sp.]|nr:MAG: imidazole glycerol phosphate synthase subunit HisH [Methylobacter sp.]
MSYIAVIDYGMGNLHSITKALQFVGPDVAVQVSAEPEIILNADRVVFPGVGAIRDCMQALRDANLTEVIKTATKNKPFLGICLGMQALLTDNEENEHTVCLDIIPGHVVRFQGGFDSKGQRLKIPHMGWSPVHQKPHPLWADIPQDSRFYFVHSYYAIPDNGSVVAATADYPLPFACALTRDNVFAVQFHPEKSHTAGLQLLKNFLHWDGNT